MMHARYGPIHIITLPAETSAWQTTLDIAILQEKLSLFIGIWVPQQCQVVTASFNNFQSTTIVRRNIKSPKRPGGMRCAIEWSETVLMHADIADQMSFKLISILCLSHARFNSVVSLRMSDLNVTSLNQITMQFRNTLRTQDDLAPSKQDSAAIVVTNSRQV